jgi:hypothetical protein
MMIFLPIMRRKLAGRLTMNFLRNKAGLTGTPTEKREFKALFGMSVEEHWNQSKLGSFGNGEWEALHQTLPDARTEAEDTIQTLITTENLMTTFKTPKKD